MTKQVLCPIRRQWVAATPEEMVRQRLLIKLIHHLQFPAAHIAVEVSLLQLAKLNQICGKIPTRRADVVCYGHDSRRGNGLVPLLLVECKAVALNDKVIRQTTGYNHYVQARFVAVVNEQEEKLGKWDAVQQRYIFSMGLRPYADLTRDAS